MMSATWARSTITSLDEADRGPEEGTEIRRIGALRFLSPETWSFPHWISRLFWKSLGGHAERLYNMIKDLILALSSDNLII